MYKFKDREVMKRYKKCEVAKDIGLSKSYFTNVINGKVVCSKLVAYAITKYLSSEAEVDMFFERVND